MQVDCSSRMCDIDDDHHFMYLFSVNAADNKQRDKGMSCIKIDIDP